MEMPEEIVIARRFRGPIDSGNGGYVSGRVAAFVDGPAEVTLRRPPPLDRPVRVEREGERVRVLDGEARVAEAGPAEVDVEVPAPVSYAEAEEARERHVRFDVEGFSECFTCGQREDGLQIHAGAITGRELEHAAPWLVEEASPEIVWAAIDCPGAYAVGGPGRGEVVLGRMAAEVLRVPSPGERCVIVAWPLGEDRRKLYAGTALFAEDGELLARARQTWIAPRPAS